MARPEPKLPQLKARLIGVVHLPALAGAPGAQGIHPAEALEIAGRRAVEEAKTFERAGFEAVILENYGDSPFYKDRVPPETIAAMAVVSAAVRETIRIPMGINILRNDAAAALAIAAVTGAEFIRVNVLSGVAASDQGWIEGQAAQLLRERNRLGAPVSIFADVHVKHARSFSSVSLEDAVADTALRGGADALIVTGSGTGKAVDMEALKLASKAARAVGRPLYVGSGATADSLKALAPWIHGVIVSSALRKGGRAGQPLDARALKAFVKAFRSSSSSRK